MNLNSYLCADGETGWTALSKKQNKEPTLL